MDEHDPAATETQPPAKTTTAALAETAPSPLWRRRPVRLAAVAVLIAAGVGVYAAVGSGPAQVHARGTLQLGPLSSVATSGTAANGVPCTTGQGYDDISAGATVTIGGDHGQALGVGPLSAGVEHNVDDSFGMPLGDCVFSFDVAVPGGQSAYTVTISHRGTQTFTPAQIAAGIALTLGQ